MPEEKETPQPADASLDYVSDSAERGTSEADQRTTGTVSDSAERGTSEGDQRTTGTGREAVEPSKNGAALDGRPATASPADREDETLLIDGRSVGGAPLTPASPAGAPAYDDTDVRGEPEAEPEMDPAVDPDTAVAPTGFAAPPAGFRGLVAALRVRRAPPTQIMIGVLCGLLGFFAVVQLRLQADDSNLRTARQPDLIRILNDLNDRSERLDLEIRDLERRRIELQFGSDRSKAALTEAEQRGSVLGILAGTVPAKGPGINLRITDPQEKIDAAVLLDTLQELRDAGAEAVQINDVRVVASTDFLDADPGSVRIDGKLVKAPYVLKVIGDPDTLGPALRIPGGVFAVLDERGATPTVETRKQITVDAIRPAADLDYARLSDPD